MTISKTHSQYGSAANDLDVLFSYWMLADSLADNAGYDNEYLNDIADKRWGEYETARKAVEGKK